MKQFLIVAMLALIWCANCGRSFAQATPAPRNRALATHHTIKAAARPFKAVAHAAVKTVTGAATFSLEAFDSTVVDPFGVALQAFADGVDMAIAAPLEALPKPLNEIGVGVHYVYEGLDYAGTQLAK